MQSPSFSARLLWTGLFYVKVLRADTQADVVGILAAIEQKLDERRRFALVVDTSAVGHVPFEPVSVAITLKSLLEVNRPFFKEYIVASSIIFSNPTTKAVLDTLLGGYRSASPLRIGARLEDALAFIASQGREGRSMAGDERIREAILTAGAG